MELDHKCIIKGKYLFMDEETFTCHMVLEYLEYPELHHYMKGNCPLSEEKTAEILHSLLDALNYLAEKGVCHRDLKP